jgi:phosphatidylethanolamine-binding protein (PEBP) family uncharacterized protein
MRYVASYFAICKLNRHRTDHWWLNWRATSGINIGLMIDLGSIAGLHKHQHEIHCYGAKRLEARRLWRPLPPVGHHRYFNKLYALDVVRREPEQPTKAQGRSRNEMKGDVLAQAEFVGTRIVLSELF